MFLQRLEVVSVEMDHPHRVTRYELLEKVEERVQDPGVVYDMDRFHSCWGGCLWI